MADGMTSTGAPAPTTQNPYGLSPSLQAFMNSVSGLGSAIGKTTPDSSQYQRPAPAATWSAGQPNSLLEQILQMRQNQAQGLGAPYQPGVAMPKVSLLYG
jgi:hypothetical protein